MNYPESISYIHNTPKFARILGNDLLRSLLGKLGNPHDDLKFIHIAGTNGKGSCAIMLAEVLMRSGYKTGLFTSPYIERFNERIKVDGEMIEDEILASITTHIRKTIENHNTPVSEFALDTAIAFEYFKLKKCDIVVLETGLGGRLDATNVIDNPLVSVIMSIGPDHMQYLGNSLVEIATEKCGIIKQNGHTVVYPIQDATVLEVIESVCREKKNSLTLAKNPEIKSGNAFVYDSKTYSLGLCGDFQKYNAATALETVNILKNQGFSLPKSAVCDGLLNAFNPARLEKLENGLLLDGAHNLPAIEALCNYLKKSEKNINLCVAMMEDKDVSGCIAKLSEIASSVVVTQIDMPRCMSAERLAKEFEKYGKLAIIKENSIDAAKLLLKITDKESIACACGSLYFVGELRTALRGV